MKTLFKSMAAMAVCCSFLMNTGSAQAGLCGPLTVQNTSNECVKVFMNNVYLGIVHEGETQTFIVNDHSHVTTINAFCEDNNDLVARVHWHGIQSQYFLAVR